LKPSLFYSGGFFVFLQKVYTMNLKIKQPILRNGNRYVEGDVIDLPDNVAKIWIKKGFATKKNKTKYETKELKVEFIEIKENETDQN
jgi:hypothetical protein